MVHETASRGFGREAEAYERSRPSYPPRTVAWLVDHLRVRPDAVVADLAAGTGKLTRLLLPTGASVVAVEPVEAMHQLHRLLPSVTGRRSGPPSLGDPGRGRAGRSVA